MEEALPEVLVQAEGESLRLARRPEEVLEDASRAAKALTKIVEDNKWMVQIGKSKHLRVEAWMTLAHFYGITGKIRECHYIQFGNAAGWEAVADAVRMSTGVAISSGEAMCLNDEKNWNVRPKYEWQNGKKVEVGTEAVPLFQLRSMAQTRAISKALRNTLAWVVVLAGYSPTPAEEMTGDEQPGEKAAAAMPQRKSETNEATGNLISDAQMRRLWAIGYNSTPPKSQAEIKEIVKRHGFESASEITRDKYESICSEVQAQDEVA